MPVVERVLPPADLLTSCDIPESSPETNRQLLSAYLEANAALEICSGKIVALQQWGSQ